jgi:DegV family protein with EDD domain
LQKIAIVTDSTADLPLSYYEDNNVSMVPLTVRFGSETFRDWIDMPPDVFYKRLRERKELPKTSQPPVQEFIDAYSKYSSYDHIVSIHISSKLSGTGQAASIAAQSSPVPVTIIDSKVTTGGLGHLVKELVAARNSEKSLDEMIATVNHIIDTATIAFYVDTIEYIEKGGRIGKASAIAGSLLDIKPILTLEDGMVAPIKKARGRKKAIRELAAYIAEKSGGNIVNAAFMHADSPQLMADIEAGMRDSGVSFNVIERSQLGPVIGTYAGPDMAAVYFMPVR